VWIWEQRGIVVGVCGGQRTQEGGREVVCVGCRCGTGDNKSKNRRGRPGKNENLSVDGVPREGRVGALIRTLCMDLCDKEEKAAKERLPMVTQRR
jgi:hypothetical protein